MIGIIDADLLGRQHHRFPNLVCEKISGYFKDHGEETHLIDNYDEITGNSLFPKQYSHIYMAKVFTDTVVPKEVMELPNLTYGGTGFYFDKAKPLPREIEHHMPDYHLYDGIQFIGDKNRKFYDDYSIGFLTRGCFRHCPFCVNQNYNRSMRWSPLEEFYDPTRKKLCFWDDNFLACKDWKEILQTVIDSGKRFIFKQGLDERLLDDEKAEMLFSAKYDSHFLFAFDNIADMEIIRDRLRIIKKYIEPSRCRFFTLCGFDWGGRWDEDFWRKDVHDLMVRINFLFDHGTLPFVMKYKAVEKAPQPYRSMLVNIARWADNVSLVKKMTYREFAGLRNYTNIGYEWFVKENPEMKELFEKRYGE